MEDFRMFLSQDTQTDTGLRPISSRICPSDWDILAQFWYPVALGAEIGDHPVKVTLLDLELALFRETSGVAAVIDVCPHRGVRLSAGSVIEGKIMCAYHGMTFNGRGQCTHVPSLGRDVKLPSSYRVRAFRTEERYGLVWVCLSDASTQAIPSVPSLAEITPDDLLFARPLKWPVSAPRQVENFIDMAHVPLVHRHTLGGSPSARIAAGRVETTRDGLILRAEYVETPFGAGERQCNYTFTVTLPFMIDFSTIDETGHDMRIINIATPVSAYECHVFQFMKNTSDVNDQHRLYLDGVDLVNIEDIKILSNLAIPDFPLTEKHEIHIPTDNAGHAYRRRLRDIGLGKSSSEKDYAASLEN
jgi:vanillate O-demethylase monooxygenase subunit